MSGRRGPGYTAEQAAEIERLEHDVRLRLAPMPERLAHSLSVASTAEALAVTYDLDPYPARVAGILHDWDKVVPRPELVARARGLGIDMGVGLDLVQPLLHGIVAARELRDLYPELGPDVLQAIARHTTAAADMTPLDEVVFVADGIEPLRPSSPGTERVRALVGRAPLDEVFWRSFTEGIVYVVSGGRYLYAGTINIYNELVRRRTRQKENA